MIQENPLLNIHKNGDVHLTSTGARSIVLSSLTAVYDNHTVSATNTGTRESRTELAQGNKATGLRTWASVERELGEGALFSKIENQNGNTGLLCLVKLLSFLCFF